MKHAKFPDIGQFEKHLGQSAPIAHSGAQYFFPRSEYLDASAGVTDAGKPIILDATGLIDSSMLPESGVSEHNLLDGDVHPDTTLGAAEADVIIMGVGSPTATWAKGRKITVSDVDPSGGNDGDIWLKY